MSSEPAGALDSSGTGLASQKTWKTRSPVRYVSRVFNDQALAVTSLISHILSGASIFGCTEDMLRTIFYSIAGDP